MIPTFPNIITKTLEVYGIDNVKCEQRTKTSVLLKSLTSINRKKVLPEIAKSLNENGVPCVYVYPSQISKSSGHIQTLDKTIYISLKPNTGATEHLKIKAISLAAKGEKEIRNIQNFENIDVIVFRNPKSLCDSILHEFEQNENVSKDILKTFSKYFLMDNPKYISWHPSVTQSEKNELAKYLGELLIGLLSFDSDWFESVVQNEDAIIPGDECSEFILPTASNFPCIDSFILGKSGTLYPISNKSGDGAAASFFSNILPNLLKYKRKLLDKSTIISALTDTAKKYDRPDINGKQIVYDVGINHILKLNNQRPHGVYLDAYAKRETKPLRMTINAIKEYLRHNERPFGEAVLKNLFPKTRYSGITSFFNREIAYQLINDKEATKIMIAILAGKGFYQANLNVLRWSRGEVAFRLTPSKNFNIKVIGDKSPYNDLTSKQGMINYKLRAI